MGDWFRRFMAMPDRQRAKLLAQLLLIFTVAVLYGLGGVSLYLRARYLSPTPIPMPMATRDGAMAPAIEPTLHVVDTPMAEPTSTESGSETRAPTLAPTLTRASPTEPPATPTPTLFPTITPAPPTSASGSTSSIPVSQDSPGQVPGTGAGDGAESAWHLLMRPQRPRKERPWKPLT